jgi:hypothetical protein
MYKLTASKIVLIVILVFPFWDLIIQKGIKTYYQVFESEPIIYAMPEFDKDGKIESLGLANIFYTYAYKYDFDTSKDFEQFKKRQENICSKVVEYIDMTAYIHEKRKTQIIKVYLADDASKRYIFIDRQQARYQIIVSKPVSYGFYKKRYYKLIDTLHNDKILAESYAIKFVTKMKYFRRDILGWQSGVNGKELMYVGGVSTTYDMLQKVLLLKTTPYNLNVFYDKGWEDE